MTQVILATEGTILSFIKKFQSYMDDPSWRSGGLCEWARVLPKVFPGPCECHLHYLKTVDTESDYITRHHIGGWEGNNE